MHIDSLRAEMLPYELRHIAVLSCGTPKILGRYAPVREFAAGGKYDIKYLPYNWGLNDQGPHGRNYSWASLIFDNIFK